MSAGRSVALNLSMDGSTGSQLSARSAQLEAARAQAAQRLSQRQRVLSRKRREAALAAKAAMIERMQRDIAAADAEIQVGWGRQCWQTAWGIDPIAFMRSQHSSALLAGLCAKQRQFVHRDSTRPGACQHMRACLGPAWAPLMKQYIALLGTLHAHALPLALCSWQGVSGVL